MTAVSGAPSGAIDTAVAFAAATGGPMDDALVDVSLLLERVFVFSPDVLSSIVLFWPVVFTWLQFPLGLQMYCHYCCLHFRVEKQQLMN